MRLPPKIAEAVTRFFLPPACREHVLGDLQEKCTSRRQYIRDSLRTVPLVIWSRIRRTTDPAVLLLEALALYIAFVAAAWQLGLALFLYREQGLARLAIPVVITLIALVIGDAWARPGERSPLRPIVEAAGGVGFAFALQALISAAWMELWVPHWILIFGGGAGILLIATVRMLFPPNFNRPRGAS